MPPMPNRDARRITRALPVTGLLAALAVSSGCQWGEDAALRGVRVLDDAAVLSAEERQSIERYLEFLETERGIDYRVAVVDRKRADLLGETVARYAQFGIGESTEGRGLLLVVNVADATARVEVGYDLEHRVRDVEAASMIRDLLAPYFAAGDVGLGIETSVERLVEVLEPSRREVYTGSPLGRTGGAGASAELLAGIDRLTPETEARLRTILVPQANPADCVRLEMAMMHKGIAFRDAPLFDEAWRRLNRPSLPPRRLQEIAADWDGPFEIARSGDHAIAYFRGEKALRFGPHFLRRTPEGWIIDASAIMEHIIYDYSNRWVAVDGDYPYLALIHEVYDMQPGNLRRRGPAWMMRAPGGP